MSSQTSPSPKPPISSELAETFFEAVREYVRWTFGNPEPTVNFHQHPILISMACRRVEDFTDPLPDEVFNAVCFPCYGPNRKAAQREAWCGPNICECRAMPPQVD